jgi:signal transduction histidine kinase
LSLCKTIMEAHDGKIEVQSKPEEGTTVSLSFPLGD